MEIGRPPNGAASALGSLWKGFGTVTSKQARSGQTGDPTQVVTTGRTTSTAMERGMRFPIEANFVDVAGVVGQTDADSTDSMDGVDVDLLLVRKNDQLRDIMDRVEGLKGSPLPTHQKEALFMYAKQLAAEVVHLLHLPPQPQKRRSDHAYRRRYAA